MAESWPCSHTCYFKRSSSHQQPHTNTPAPIDESWRKDLVKCTPAVVSGGISSRRTRLRDANGH